MNFLLVCGGSAGHINPALAIAGALRSLLPGCGILFVGSGRSLESKLVPDAGYDIVHIKASGLERGMSPAKLFKNAVAVGKLFAASAKAERILAKFDPDAVIGTGGYICYPVLRRAARNAIPTFVHESNAVPGLAVKALSGIVTRVFASFPGTEDKYIDPKRVTITGTPVRPGFGKISKTYARQMLGCGDAPLVLSFWGSLGAERMNGVMEEFIRKNISSGAFHHIHATGRYDAGLSSFTRETLPDFVELRQYIDDMPKVMAAADLVLCRSGASTLAELGVMGKPALLVPSPFVPNNHQELNALAAEKSGGAVMMKESDCTGETLYDAVVSLLEDPETLDKMSGAQLLAAMPQAADRIAELIVELC